MTEGSSAFTPVVLIIGLVAIVTVPMRAGLARFGVPDVVGYILLGLAITSVNSRFPFLSEATRHGIDTLAAAGVVALLFRAGLESHPRKLMRQLPRASFAFFGNILASAALGYLVMRYLIGTGPLPAMFVATALSATSVGVSVAVWRDAGAIDSDQGALLLDLAELDDVAAVVLLALLLAVAPIAYGIVDGKTLPHMFAAVGWLGLKLSLFAVACLWFASYAEKPVMKWLRRLDASADTIIPVAGFAFVIAAISDHLGFSLAIGALLAGLAFSRDPKRVRLDKAFDTLFRLFVPFFFIGIGLNMAIDSMATTIAWGCLLLVVAVLAKVAGTTLPLIAGTGGAGALLIGVSMVPRAEIAMIVMDRGRALGDWAVPPEIYGAMVVVTLGTCLLTPPVVNYMLRRAAAKGDHDDH